MVGDRITLAFNLVSTLIITIVSIIILSPALWLVGRSLVGKDKAKFTDAILIVAIGTLVGAVLGALVSGIISWIVMVVVWLALIKHFFDCGWLKALLVAIVTIVVFIIIGVVLALLGFALFSSIL
jgi:hypothetical protein